MAVLCSQSHPDHRIFLSLPTRTHPSKVSSQGTSSRMSSLTPLGKVKEFSLWTTCPHLSRDTCHIATITCPQICRPNLFFMSPLAATVLIILHSPAVGRVMALGRCTNDTTAPWRPWVGGRAHLLGGLAYTDLLL